MHIFIFRTSTHCDSPESVHSRHTNTHMFIELGCVSSISLTERLTQMTDNKLEY